MTDPINLPYFRDQIHRAQNELAPIIRDSIYIKTDGLQQLVWQDLPDLWAALVRAQERREYGLPAEPTP
jgi:hypothetical protein